MKLYQYYNFNFEEIGHVTALECATFCRDFPWMEQGSKKVELEAIGEKHCSASVTVSNGRYNMLVMSEDGIEFNILVEVPLGFFKKILTKILRRATIVGYFADFAELEKSIEAFFTGDWNTLRTISST